MNSLNLSSHFNSPHVLRALLVAEGCAILFTILAFWHHSPPIRDQWIWLLWLPVIFFWLRMRLTNQLWTHTPLHDWLVIFVLLTAFNFAHAPYARQDFMVLISRPLLGIWIVIYSVEHARVFQRLHGLVAVAIGVGLLTALLALTATDWQTAEKAAGLQGIIDTLPVFDYREAARQSTTEICLPILQPIIQSPCFRTADLLANSLLSFNPNEIAGALAWLIPLMTGIAVIAPRTLQPDRAWQILRGFAAIAATLGLLALILGQSRFAIGGVMVALALILLKMVDHAIIRKIALGGVALLVLVQIFFVLNIAPGNEQTGISTRDQRTFSTRFELWERGFRMMADYPLTGVGMSMYRSAIGTDRYAIEYYRQQGNNPPHAHNEWAQVAADLGVPGLLLYLVWQFVVLRMLWQGWQGTHPHSHVVAGAVFAGLLAHAAYGIGDAITLWDRFQFILWLLVGLAAAGWFLRSPQDVDKS